MSYSGSCAGQPEWERLHEPEDLTAWLTERFGDPASPVTPAQFRAARQLRTAITRIAIALADGATPDPAAIDTPPRRRRSHLGCIPI